MRCSAGGHSMNARLLKMYVFCFAAQAVLMGQYCVKASQQTDDYTHLLNITRFDGFVECVIQRTDLPDVEVCGYDSRSGAWYELHAGIGWGRTSVGRTTVLYASDKLRSWAQSLSTSTYLEQFALPTIGFHKLLLVRAGVESVAKKPDGGFLASVIMPDFEPIREGQPVTDEMRKTWTFVYETDEDGCPLRRTRVGEMADSIDLTRIGTAEGGIPVCTMMPGVWSLVSGTLKPSGSSALNEQTIKEAIEFSRAAQAEARRQHLQTKPTNSPDLSRVRDDTNLTRAFNGHKLEWLLIVVGSILIVGACAVWIRNRRAGGAT